MDWLLIIAGPLVLIVVMLLITCYSTMKCRTCFCSTAEPEAYIHLNERRVIHYGVLSPPLMDSVERQQLSGQVILS
jgi:hypothetical protein